MFIRTRVIMNTKRTRQGTFAPCRCFCLCRFIGCTYLYFFCSTFHSSNSRLPSSVSKKAWISGKKHLASASNSCFGILHLFAAIRQHGCHFVVGQSSFTSLFQSHCFGFDLLFSSVRVCAHGQFSFSAVFCHLYLRTSSANQLPDKQC